MDLNLSPQIADATLFEGEGGGYYAWTPAKSPALPQADLSVEKLVLQPHTFCLPHYPDSNKICYIVEVLLQVHAHGEWYLPNSPQEKVLTVKKGDFIPMPAGTIMWSFNGGDSKVTILVFAKCSQGKINYILLTGPLGFLGGFSTEFITEIYHFDEPSDSEKLAKSQSEPFIVKLDREIDLPATSPNSRDHVVFNLDQIDDHVLCNGENFPLLDKIGLSASLVKLGHRSVMGPTYSTDSSDPIIYVTRGSGRVQIVGLNGTMLLDSSVEKDQLFLVPKFFAVAQLAGEQGLEFLCVSTSPRPELGRLVGSESVWNAPSPSVLQATLNVSPEFVKLFKAKAD